MRHVFDDKVEPWHPHWRMDNRINGQTRKNKNNVPRTRTTMVEVLDDNSIVVSVAILKPGDKYDRRYITNVLAARCKNERIPGNPPIKQTLSYSNLDEFVDIVSDKNEDFSVDIDTLKGRYSAELLAHVVEKIGKKIQKKQERLNRKNTISVVVFDDATKFEPVSSPSIFE